MSSFELYILKILQRERCVFEREKTFSDLRGGKYRFDFYIPNYKGKQLLIEVDGEQHFWQVKHFQKTKNDFKKTQEHDRRKNRYALSHNITLIRLPFWEINNIFTIEDMLQSQFIVKDKYHNDNIKVPSLHK